jgi:hypothetical protein
MNVGHLASMLRAVIKVTARVRHRLRLLAEPEPALSQLSQREQRAVLWELLGLPPYETR